MRVETGPPPRSVWHMNSAHTRLRNALDEISLGWATYFCWAACALLRSNVVTCWAYSIEETLYGIHCSASMPDLLNRKWIIFRTGSSTGLLEALIFLNTFRLHQRFPTFWPKHAYVRTKHLVRFDRIEVVQHTEMNSCIYALYTSCLSPSAFLVRWTTLFSKASQNGLCTMVNVIFCSAFRSILFPQRNSNKKDPQITGKAKIISFSHKPVVTP